MLSVVGLVVRTHRLTTGRKTQQRMMSSPTMATVANASALSIWVLSEAIETQSSSFDNVARS